MCIYSHFQLMIHVHVMHLCELVLASFILVNLWSCAIEDVHDDSKWQIFILANGYQNIKFTTFSSLQNFLLYGIHVHVYMLLYMNSLSHFLMVKCMLVRAKSLICTLLYSLISILSSPSLLSLPLFLLLLLFSLSDWNSLRGSSYLLGLH